MMAALIRRSAFILATLILLDGCAPTPVGLALNDQQHSEIEQAQDYLNGLTRFEARFDQSGSFGTGGGWIWIDRPGRLRISYFGPNGQQMVASGDQFVVYNPTNDATTTMPVARTPLGLLLAPRITLSGTVVITAFNDSGSQLSLTLADKAHPAQGTLSVTLQKNPLLLTSVTATDIRGRTLAMSLSDIQRNPVIPPDLFLPPGHALPGS